MKKADAILISDPHARETIPIARTKKEFFKAQWDKWKFLKDLQKQHNCPVLCGGDLFDYWKPSPELISKTIENLPKQFHTIYGQHDLPQHSMDLAYKCGIWTLAVARSLKILPIRHWGMKTEKDGDNCVSTIIKSRKILVWHTYNYQGKQPWPGCTSPTGRKLLKKHPQYDLILTGDNHIPFTEEYKGRLLVNPGSMMRTTAAQIKHKPRVYLWYADTNTVEPVYLPIKKRVVSREHIEIKEKRDNRIDAFISRLDKDWEIEFSFEINLKKFNQKNKVNKKIIKLINKVKAIKL